MGSKGEQEELERVSLTSLVRENQSLMSPNYLFLVQLPDCCGSNLSSSGDVDMAVVGNCDSACTDVGGSGLWRD